MFKDWKRDVFPVCVWVSREGSRNAELNKRVSRVCVGESESPPFTAVSMSNHY